MTLLDQAARKGACFHRSVGYSAGYLAYCGGLSDGYRLYAMRCHSDGDVRCVRQARYFIYSGVYRLNALLKSRF